MKTYKLRVIGLCEGNSPMTGEFPSQRASNAESVSIWLCHHVAEPVQVEWPGRICGNKVESNEIFKK